MKTKSLLCLVALSALWMSAFGYEEGETLISDDFSSSKSGWASYTEGDFLTAYKDGMYQITVVSPNYYHEDEPTRLNLTDFVLQIDAIKLSGPDDNAFGVAVRIVPLEVNGTFEGNYDLYTFLISSDGYYAIGKLKDLNWSDFRWTKSDAINKGDETNTIRVEAIGNRFTFYVNDVEIDQFTDSENSMPVGFTGLYIGSLSEGNVTIGFDNFKLSEIIEEETDQSYSETDDGYEEMESSTEAEVDTEKKLTLEDLKKKKN